MTQARPTAGVAHRLQDGLACVVAPNPSPMTHWGTNTYLLGHETLCVIDPGPASDGHFQALMAAIGPRRVSHILVTHSHLDHSPLARPLSDATGAPIHAFGDSTAGRSDVMRALAKRGDIGGGEGVDRAFAPDVQLASGDRITGDGWALDALHTPGHFGNHVCFTWGAVAFTGDHVMGWASSLVSPPDGDLTDFMASCHALAKTHCTRGYAGHGAPIENLQPRIADLINHRTSREKAILGALDHGPATPAALTSAVYTDTPKALRAAAMRNVLAHLIDLHTRGVVGCKTAPSVDAVYHRN